jgi:hypothetical protein
MDIMNKLPLDVANLVFRFVSHPTADLIKQSVKDTFLYFKPWSKTKSPDDPAYLGDTIDYLELH